MRTPRNDRAALNEPERTCILTRTTGARGGLVRLALAPDGAVWPDVRAKAPGRGAWIGVTHAALREAQAKGRLRGALARAFKTNDFQVPDGLGERIEAELRRAVLDRLGLEARAGTLLTGGERLAIAARSGGLFGLYHAEDAGSDGAGRLAQAWRVGSDREGSGLAGMTLPLSRTTLSLALGRENVVHIGLTDERAAARVADAVARWLHFLGTCPATEPCETGSEGASASAYSAGHDTARHEGL